MALGRLCARGGVARVIVAPRTAVQAVGFATAISRPPSTRSLAQHMPCITRIAGVYRTPPSPRSLTTHLTTLAPPLAPWTAPRRGYHSDEDHRKAFESTRRQQQEEEHEQEMRRRSGWVTNLVRATVAVEVGVFVMWMYGRSTSPAAPSAMALWMNDNFVLSWRNIDAGRWWTVVTCNLSHNNPLHLFLNVSFTLTLGRILSMLALRPLAQVGSLALATSLAASAAFLTQTKPQREQSLTRTPTGAAQSMGALGASGMNSGFLAATACMVPRLQLSLFGVVPLRVWQIALLCAAIDAYFLEAQTGIGHSAHLGGAVAGVVWWAALRRVLPRVMIP